MLSKGDLVRILSVTSWTNGWNNITPDLIGQVLEVTSLSKDYGRDDILPKGGVCTVQLDNPSNWAWVCSENIELVFNV